MNNNELFDIVNSGKYVGGDLEIQNNVEDYMYRGKIKSIETKDANALHIEFDIFVKMGKEGWEQVEAKSYGVGLLTATVSDIGDDRILINTGFVSNEICVLFLASKSNMDWEKFDSKECEV